MWEWIKRSDRCQDGSLLAFITLGKHYEGPGEVDCQIALARQQVCKLHYKVEENFAFEAPFVTQLNGAFQVLVECDEGLMEKFQVETMINRMSQCTN